MQTAIFVLSLFGLNFAVVEYSGETAEGAVVAHLLCIDNGQEGTCYNASLEVESAYDCGPRGCESF